MKINITEEENGITVKQYMASQKFSARLIARLKNKERGILVNGERKTVRCVLSAGDILELETEDSESSKNISLSYMPINILFEDEWFIAVEKPPHLPIHPSRRHIDDTLASRVMAHFEGTDFVFRVLTRLDLDTSGVVLVAKNAISAASFSKMLTERKVKKEYLAICEGVFENHDGIIDFNIRRTREFAMEREAVAKGISCGENSPEGNEAISEYYVVKQGKNATLVAFSPVTGRTHQLRVHSKAIGHPILGDTLYGSPSEYIDRQALHAQKLTFIHPFTKLETYISCPLPEDIKNCMKELFDE
ncbi:MAG: RluA family pseudouridine synthase [Ruminococcaceae bacterium]|nr:RluA family pseudouridine synthase [Oscillospiraceae bacterium]